MDPKTLESLKLLFLFGISIIADKAEALAKAEAAAVQLAISRKAMTQSGVTETEMNAARTDLGLTQLLENSKPATPATSATH